MTGYYEGFILWGLQAVASWIINTALPARELCEARCGFNKRCKTNHNNWINSIASYIILRNQATQRYCWLDLLPPPQKNNRINSTAVVGQSSICPSGFEALQSQALLRKTCRFANQCNLMPCFAMPCAAYKTFESKWQTVNYPLLFGTFRYA